MITNLQKLIFLQIAFAIEAEKAGCVSCDPNDFDYPAYLDGCIDELEQAGIAGWFAVKCDAPFTDITSEAEWDVKIAAGEVFGRYDGDFIRGSQEIPARDEVTVGACGRAKTIAKNYTATLFDSAYESTNSKYDLYDYLDKKGNLWNFGFIQCDGTTYGPFANVTVKPDETIGETNSVQKEFQILFEWKQGLGINKPVLLPFLIGKQLHT